MPWRSRSTPYRVWVSEIMLQQTRVETVIPYFRRFMKRFPSLRRLAECDLQDVLRAWEGLGYYSRARNLHRAAQIIRDTWGGRVPRTVEGLRALPGVGRYTAAAIASICFGVPVPAVDGNVLRVMARFLGVRQDIRGDRTVRSIERSLCRVIPVSSPGPFNEALMDLGARVCVSRHPRCGTCPLRHECAALRRGWTEKLPVRGRAKTGERRRLVAGIVRRGGRLLVVQRPDEGMLGGLWEFPGGRREAGESPGKAVARTCHEQAGVRIGAAEPVCKVAHTYSHFSIDVDVYKCRELSRTTVTRGNRRIRWIWPSALRDYPMHTAARKIVHHLGLDEKRVESPPRIPLPSIAAHAEADAQRRRRRDSSVGRAAD